MPHIPRILIVDDNLDHRVILTHQLGKIGTFAIREAGDGQQALAVIASVLPDLIFMNLRLPILDGWETIRQIRALPAPLAGSYHRLYSLCRGPGRTTRTPSGLR
jgi:CheY-like chemotaxis protein